MISPLELRFLASEELIEVEVSSYINTISLIHASYSDLVPLSITKIPLYIALELQKGNFVQIRSPNYYSFNSLNSLLEDEVNNEKEYCEIPSHIFSTGKLVIQSSYNCDKKEECLNLIEKIKEVRLKKTLNGLSKMEGRALTLSNLTLYEWYEIKEMLVGPMEERRKLL